MPCFGIGLVRFRLLWVSLGFLVGSFWLTFSRFDSFLVSLGLFLACFGLIWVVLTCFHSFGLGLLVGNFGFLDGFGSV